MLQHQYPQTKLGEILTALQSSSRIGLLRAIYQLKNQPFPESPPILMFISTSLKVGKKGKQTEKLTAKGMGSWKGSVVKRRSSYVVVQLKKKIS